MSYINEIFKFKYFIIGTLIRIQKNKCNNTILGYLWIFIIPLSHVLIFTLLYTYIIGGISNNADRINLGIYICLGIIHWTLFQDILLKTMNMFTTYSNFIKNLNFPKITLPIIIILESLINYLIPLFFLVLYIIFTGKLYILPTLIVIAIAIMLSLFASFIGIILSIFSTFYKDIKNGITIILQILFWTTPIVYSIKNTTTFNRYLEINPLFYFFSAIQDLFLNNNLHILSNIIIILILNLILLLLTLLLSKLYINKVVDNI